MKIFVGSTNPVKVNAVTNAASETWPDVLVVGLKTASGVGDQPLSDEETRLGAVNRAKAVLQRGLTKSKDARDDECLGVGLEGGVFFDQDKKMWTTVWAAVVDRQGNLFLANGARFLVPDIVAERINRGEEMGPIMADLLQEHDIRSKQGMIGVITKNFVDRTEEYQGIVKMALGLWYGRNWQKEKGL